MLIRSLISAVLIFFTVNATALTAQSVIVTDMDGEVLFEKNPDEQRSIASITKLFVADHALKLNPDELLTVTKDDIRKGSMRSTPLRAGKSYLRRDLIELALVSSDNVAAYALARNNPIATIYATLIEPSGLSPNNVSTARGIANAARTLYLTSVGEISTHDKTTIGNRNSTNPFLTKAGWYFYLSKTGFINQAGGCLVVVLEVNQRPVTIVILGARRTKERWEDLIEIRKMLGDKDFYVPIKVTKIKRKNK